MRVQGRLAWQGTAETTPPFTSRSPEGKPIAFVLKKPYASNPYGRRARCPLRWKETWGHRTRTVRFLWDMHGIGEEVASEPLLRRCGFSPVVPKVASMWVRPDRLE